MSKAKPKAKPGASEAKPKRIAKADGDAPVQAYIAGMASWQRDLGPRRSRGTPQP